ncbi:MAG: hypothetical protein V4690_03885 [Patescibacteria group bacterium]
MKKNKGFTLLVAIITTSMLLIVSFVVVNIAYKQLIIADANEQSQYAFYAADAGTECAVYWDLVNSEESPFATDAVAASINCNGQTITTGSQTDISTIPTQSSRIGGAATSTFQLNFTKGCVIVRVGKHSGNMTIIDSRGYNTCDINSPRRFERGVTLTY